MVYLLLVFIVGSAFGDNNNNNDCTQDIKQCFEGNPSNDLKFFRDLSATIRDAALSNNITRNEKFETFVLIEKKLSILGNLFQKTPMQ